MADKKYRVGYTTGVYDMFHIGHLNILKRAKEQCEYLIVGVTTDELCESRKGKLPIICQDDRVEIVRSIRYVDKVVLQNDMDKLAAVKKYNAGRSGSALIMRTGSYRSRLNLLHRNRIIYLS